MVKTKVDWEQYAFKCFTRTKYLWENTQKAGNVSCPIEGWVVEKGKKCEFEPHKHIACVQKKKFCSKLSKTESEGQL